MGKKKNKTKQENLEKLDFLLNKSRYQLEQSISAFSEAKRTSHIHLGISTFLFTLLISIINTNGSDWYSLLFIVPISLILFSFFKIVSNLYAVKLSNGKKIEYFENALDEEIGDLKETEIADVLRSNDEYNNNTMGKNKIIKLVGILNLFSLILTIFLFSLKVLVKIH